MSGGIGRPTTEQALSDLAQERREIVDIKMPQPLSDEELRDLTPEKLYEWFGQAVVSLSDMVDSLDHRVSPLGTNKVQDITFGVRAQIPGHPFWVERTVNGRVW